MKTFRVQRTFDPVKLHTELQAAGIPVLTVRSSSSDLMGPAVYGVVVTEDGVDVAKTEALIQAHQEARNSSLQPNPQQIEASLREMEKV